MTTEVVGRPDPVLVGRVADRLALDGRAATPAAVTAVLRAEGSLLADPAVLDLVRAVRAELTGAGPLDELLADPDVSDVLVNGPREVWVDRGDGLEPVVVGDLCTIPGPVASHLGQ